MSKGNVVSTPAGWYPQPDGQQRYWDGEQWTAHFAPGAAPVAPPPTGAQGEVPVAARKNWFLRHKVITAIGAVLLLGTFSNLASGGASSESMSTVAIEPAAEPVATPAVPDKAAAEKAAAEAAAFQATLDKQAVADKATADKAAAARSAADKAAARKAAAPQLGQAVRDGKFSFTVTAVKCGIAQVGTSEFLTQKAQGQYCRVSLKVANIGNEAQTMFANNQYLFDTKARKFSADPTANLYDDSAKLMFEEINPGNSIKGYVFFDVPKGTKVSKLELHDSMLSGGIDVRL
jgi:Domain of unknown function (DUF4352)/Protein of unknown function (DUF2510)